MHKVKISEDAIKDLAKIPLRYANRIDIEILKLAEDPRPRECVKLKGKRNLYRIRIGMYRIIYSIHDDCLIVKIIKIGQRKDIYRKI
jgi:mRNA interferase RelE/StbE